MYIHFYVPVPVKYLLFRGMEFEKALTGEVAAGRRAAACLVIHAALRRGENDGENALGLESFWDCNSAAFVNSQGSLS